MSYIKSRGKDLKPDEIEEFFNEHLPYRMKILMTYVNIEKDSNSCFRKDVGVRNCTFEACLVMCRVLMNFLGLSSEKDNHPKLMGYKEWVLRDKSKSPDKSKSDDVKVTDLHGEFDLRGEFVDIDKDLTPEQKDLLARVYLMANKASAHLTYRNSYKYKPNELADAAELILKLIKTKLEDKVNRKILIT